MFYVDYAYYKSLYGDASMDEASFNRLCWMAQKKIDNATTGIDGFRKLKSAFPTNEDDAETVKRCLCALLMVAYNIEQAEKRISLSKGYVENADGTLKGKVVKAISSGNETIEYSLSGGTSERSVFDVVVADKNAQEKLYFDTIKEFLSGVPDNNGVNLLYMGKYPYMEVLK